MSTPAPTPPSGPTVPLWLAVVIVIGIAALAACLVALVDPEMIPAAVMGG